MMPKPEESHLAHKMQLARFGFTVVPTIIQHRTLGFGELRMGATGIDFYPFDKEKTGFSVTWENFDKAPTP